MSPRVAGASPRNRPRSIPLGTTRISPAGMPVAAASSVRLASEIVTAMVPGHGCRNRSHGSPG